LEGPVNFSTLFQRYINNQCSPAEVDELFELLKTDTYKAYVQELIEKQVAREASPRPLDTALQQRLEQRLQNILQQEKSKAPITKVRFLSRTAWWAAAAIIMIVSISGYLWLAGKQDRSIANIGITPTTDIVAHIRNITLPDGSMIVLQAGSKLTYAAGFNTGSREVTLTGEAYFNIIHDPAQPFIIHTGNIKTTVLGTAFNIRSYEGAEKVVVAVTQGKVKVEDSKRELAILKSNEEIIYHVLTDSLEKQTVNATRIVTDWTREHMNFKSSSLGAITKVLSIRYGLPIRFANPALENCLVTASFSGTESLQEILTAICTILGDQYEIKDNQEIIITGKGCESAR
jgi:transmembrane sensor